MTKNYVAVLVFFLALIELAAQGTNSALAERFKEPPQNAPPSTWMHAMSGEIRRNAHFFPISNGTKTTIILNAGESIFVVFRESADDINPVSFDLKDVDFSLTETDSIRATVYESGKYYVPLASGNTWSIDAKDILEAIPILGNWEVSFDAEGGFGKTLQFDDLMDRAPIGRPT